MRFSLSSALQSALLLVVSVIVALALCEVGLRVFGFSFPSFFRPDERLGLRLRPNVEGWFRSEGEGFVRINSAGFRDRDRTLPKPPGTFRIVVLGDSMIEALQVDLENTFAAQLERRLNDCSAFGAKKVEVLNLGVSSYGTAQELLTYRYFGAKYSPDMALLAFFVGNDVRNNSKALEPEKVRPFFALQGDGLVEDMSFATSDEFRRRTNTLRTLLDHLGGLRVVQAIYFIKDRLQARGAAGPAESVTPGAEAGIDTAAFSAPTTPEWTDAWEITARLVRQLRDEVRTSGAQLAVLSLPTGIQVNPDPAMRRAFADARKIDDIFYPNHRVEKIAADLGVQSIALGPALQTGAEKAHAFLNGFPNTRLGSGHWNEAGHRMAAEVVAASLCAKQPAAVGSR